MSFNKKLLTITPASFEEAFDLQAAISNALRGNNIDIPDSMDKDINISTFLDAALSTIASKEVRNCLMVCAESVTYGKDADRQKVDSDFFSDEKNRELYYPIMIEIIKVNVGPFISGLLSMLKIPNLKAISGFLK